MRREAGLLATSQLTTDHLFKMSQNTVPTVKAKDYKSSIKPVWCPGCGHFAVLTAITKALAY